jgi:predicted HTH domain antitoxin
MRTLTIPYSEDLLLLTGQSAESLEQEMRFLLATKLFELKRLSLGKAAEFCAMNKVRFMYELGRLKIPVINLEEDQIQDELKNDY